MKVLAAKNNPSYYDIFMSQEGWDNWTRIIYNKDNNSIRIIGGNKLRYLEAMKVVNYLNKVNNGK